METHNRTSGNERISRRKFVGLTVSGAAAITILPNYTVSGPVSSSIRFRYLRENGRNLDLYWMDGGITPERPLELEQDVKWIDACIAGYGNAEVSSPFEGYAGLLTETVLMGNLLLRSFNIRQKIKRVDPVYGEMEGFVFPGRYINFKWDGPNMRVTNFDQANQFVKREYRKGWGGL